MSTTSMILTKKNIIILSIIIITIISYQFYITSPSLQSNTITNTINTSGKGLDYTELLNLQKDLKVQQTEIRKQLEILKYSINDINQQQNNKEYNNNKLNDEQLEKEEEEKEKDKEKEKEKLEKKNQKSNSLINYEEKVKKTSKEQPNTCIPIEGKLLCLPNFIVIGTMKSGTTFLDYYLQRHPQIAHHSKKEIWYFNSYYGNGIEWYAKHFEQYSSLENQKLIGEATPFYINNPNTAPRLFTTLKNAKLILLLRDPVERSLSQYHFSIQWLKRNKSPPLEYSFEHLIYEEADVIETCIRGHERYRDAYKQRKEAEKNGEIFNEEFNLVDPYYSLHSEKNWTFYKDCVRCDKCFQTGTILHTSGHPTFGMLAKSLYFEQLDHWLNYFPLSQIHIIRYEDIASQPESVLSELEDFLDINHIDYGEFKPRNVVQHDPMNDEIRSYLINYFKNNNEKLYNLLNRDFNWQK
ncbi:hypothetical protein RB653_007861 [Dictyostelium firmibasis]|uniref:Sulfotransferase domain-containing protein n=1 Tax=Dictyostelium firmibasis TaxID=79012 RepID=A0AAN7TV46_9MYCE